MFLDIDKYFFGNDLPLGQTYLLARLTSWSDLPLGQTFTVKLICIFVKKKINDYLAETKPVSLKKTLKCIAFINKRNNVVKCLEELNIKPIN